jgi:predicted Na+-dependent transporter
MMKFLNRWLRKIHRWLSVPTFLSIPLMIFARMTQEAYFDVPQQVEMVQQILILFLAITGAYLYFIPYIVKWQRKRRLNPSSGD